MMQHNVSLSGDLGQEASVLCYEGTLADAKGELERAEVCFAHVVDIDRRLHGPVHSAVADALNSLAMVRAAAVRHEAAPRPLRSRRRLHEDHLADDLRSLGARRRRLARN